MYRQLLIYIISWASIVNTSPFSFCNFIIQEAIGNNKKARCDSVGSASAGSGSIKNKNSQSCKHKHTYTQHHYTIANTMITYIYVCNKNWTEQVVESEELHDVYKHKYRYIHVCIVCWLWNLLMSVALRVLDVSWKICWGRGFGFVIRTCTWLFNRV